MPRKLVTMDGNEAAAYVAYKASEVIAIYPITPASPMGELADAWAAAGETNLWGEVPRVQELQSEGGAAGAIHGALQAGALATTFTASQGLLLMLPNLYKIAGELTSTVFHIAARAVATQGLSIFGDHSDVMAARTAGWAMLFANTPQEVMDLALIAHASTLRARVPFLHVFDGFRTSHEVQKVERLDEADIRALIDEDLVRAHRLRALSPDRPFIRGTAQNPDVYFQSRETVNPYYAAVPGIVQAVMEQFAARTGRRYRPFEYCGAPDAERVVVLMGSGCEAAQEAVEALRAAGERVGLVKVRLYRPFDAAGLLAALPASVRAIAVLDRTKEPGAAGEPLYQDVVTAVSEGVAAGTAPFAGFPTIVGGRYGLGSKEFTPAMVRAVLDNLKQARPKNHFTVGIVDDVTGSSLPVDETWDTEPDDVVRAVFWGLGSDGTVGANKNSIKIIGEETPYYVQGYFVYDSKKAGSVTVSHLRFGPRPIHSTYQIRRANFVACHQFSFLERLPVLAAAAPGATFLLSSPYGPGEVWQHLPRPVREEIIARRLRFYVIDAGRVARAAGLGGRINTIMQTCFFALSGVLPREEAIAAIKRAIRKTYGRRGEAVVRQNEAAVDAALAHLQPVAVPAEAGGGSEPPAPVPATAPEFVRRVTAELMAGRGDQLPVSALPADGTYPSGTARWEKRSIAAAVPVWEPDLCIQCGKCVLVCPHAAIRAKVVEPAALAAAPAGFRHSDARWVDLRGRRYTLQVAVEDCTGCGLCVEVCPARDRAEATRRALHLEPQPPLREAGRAAWEFFLALPGIDGDGLPMHSVKNVQLLEPTFEFPGACAGCGETPYLRLLSQLFGDRALIANATGCSSIYGGNLPTTPWSVNREGRGPAWSNSLFEDNAEFGLGMRLALDQQAAYARSLLQQLREPLGPALVDRLLGNPQDSPTALGRMRRDVAALKAQLMLLGTPEARDLLAVADALVKKSVWIVGGDGWAYDIGYGGLDHVLAGDANVNVLVLDTQVYSNTGGQASKATPRGAVARFAAGGRSGARKDLGYMAMSYGHVYVAQVAMGANDGQTVRALSEAESYEGPSLIIAYCHCIAHGIDMGRGMAQQKLAVDTGLWPLYRFDPRLAAQGRNPLQLDSKGPRIPLREFMESEGRFNLLARSDPAAAQRLLAAAQAEVRERWRLYEQLAQIDYSQRQG